MNFTPQSGESDETRQPVDRDALTARAELWALHRPIRIVCDRGSATLSVLFPDPDDLATALHDARPRTDVDR